MNRTMRALTVLGALAAATIPGFALADPPCDNNFAVYSGAGSDLNVLACLVEPSGDPDMRIIQPGTTSVSAAYLQDLGADVPFVMGTFDGLGFNNKAVKFTRAVRTGGSVTYDTASMPLPNGRASSGCLTVSITFGTGEEAFTESSSYHTVDASCPAG